MRWTAEGKSTRRGFSWTVFQSLIWTALHIFSFKEFLGLRAEGGAPGCSAARCTETTEPQKKEKKEGTKNLRGITARMWFDWVKRGCRAAAARSSALWRADVLMYSERESGVWELQWQLRSAVTLESEENKWDTAKIQSEPDIKANKQLAVVWRRSLYLDSNNKYSG